MSYTLDDQALDLLFRTARTYNHWRNVPIPDDILRTLHALMCLGPTSANCQPVRLLFVKSPAAKARLRAGLSAGNIEQTMTAPVTVIIGYDLAFDEQLPRTFPHADARSWFSGNDLLRRETAFRNGTLQGAYLMMAARALGLDCGPISGFDNATIDTLFFPNSTSQSNFLCNLGYGDPSNLYPRNPRLSFEEQCQIL